jgi:hypothetical protein
MQIARRALGFEMSLFCLVLRSGTRTLASQRDIKGSLTRFVPSRKGANVAKTHCKFAQRGRVSAGPPRAGGRSTDFEVVVILKVAGDRQLGERWCQPQSPQCAKRRRSDHPNSTFEYCREADRRGINVCTMQFLTSIEAIPRHTQPAPTARSARLHAVSEMKANIKVIANRRGH